VRVALRCTTRLLDLLGVRRASLAPVEPDGDDWYANLLWIDRRKCLLLMHADTAFSVFVPDIRKTEVAPPGPFVRRAIVAALVAEGFAVDALGPLEETTAVLATTASRRVLGYMNDTTFHLEHMAAASGGVSARMQPSSTAASNARSTTTTAPIRTRSSGSQPAALDRPWRRAAVATVGTRCRR
jgi:hypothetical protein